MASWACRLAGILVLISAFTVNGSLSAQGRSVSVGAVVRLWTLPSGPVATHTGTVTEMTDDTIVLAVKREGRRLAFHRRDIDRLTVRADGHPLAGGFRGAAIGLLVGAAVGALYGNQIDDASGEYSRSDLQRIYGAAGAGIGVVGGAFVGVVLNLDRWSEVSFGKGADLAPVQNSRVKIALVVRF